MDTTVLTKGPGALDRAEKIENYYGLAQPVSGAELERRSIENAKRLGVRFVTAEAVGTKIKGSVRIPYSPVQDGENCCRHR